MMDPTPDWTPNISDAAVKAATGKDWAQWRADLDAWAGELDHKTLAQRLREERGLSGWWSQMVSGSWEMMTGRRDPHQRCGDGKFQASASKTVKATIESVEDAFELPTFANWGPDGVFTRSSGTPGKSINGAWSGGGRLSVWLTRPAEDRTQIGLSHEGIETADDCEHWKAEWREAMTRLKTVLET
tara:strand:+ start:436 stop:993 length:558 start_codon:yes stop_codon:yes gene_type:complete